MEVGICVNYSVRLQTNRSYKKNQVTNKVEIKFDFPVLIQNNYTAEIRRNKLLLCTKTAVRTSLITMCYFTTLHTDILNNSKGSGSLRGSELYFSDILVQYKTNKR